MLQLPNYFRIFSFQQTIYSLFTTDFKISHEFVTAERVVLETQRQKQYGNECLVFQPLWKHPEKTCQNYNN